MLFQNQEAQSEILHTRVICLVAVGIGALLLQPPLQAALFGTSAGGLSQYLTSVSVPFYLLFLVYFLMGFFLYATIYAGLGALVKRQDEVQSAVVIPMLLLISGYVMIYLAVYFPNADMGEGAFVYSILDTYVDACPSCSGLCRLVGYRIDDCIDARNYLRLCLVFRAHLSLRCLDVRAKAWSWSDTDSHDR